jgi:tRNA A58 N-methylase Trm61
LCKPLRIACATAPADALEQVVELRQVDVVSGADRQFKVGRKLVERLGIGLGERVLDVRAGTGLVAQWVSERVGPEGFVAGLDPLAYRIELANARAKPNLTFRVGTAAVENIWLRRRKAAPSDANRAGGQRASAAPLFARWF